MEKSGGPSVGQPPNMDGDSGGQQKKPRHQQPVNRKRTKTGCLSESSGGILYLLEGPADSHHSLSQETHQVRRGQTHMQQLHQV
jgi:hypothetical protein